LTNPTIVLSFQQNWLSSSNQNNQNSSISILKVFSGKSSNKVHIITRKGRGFADIKIIGEKGINQHLTCVIH